MDLILKVITIAFIATIFLVILMYIYNGNKVKKVYKDYLKQLKTKEYEMINYNGKLFEKRVLNNENLKNIVDHFIESVKLDTVDINTEVIIEKNIDCKIVQAESKIENGSSVSVALGLLGTFTGLTIAIIGASNAMSNSGSMEGFIKGMQMPMAGMGMAFATTIAGVIGSLWINREVRIMKLIKDEFYDEMEDYLDNYIYANYTFTEKHVLSNMLDNKFNSLNKCINNNMNNIVKEMEIIFKDGVTDFVNQSFNSLVNSVDNSMNKLVGEMNILFKDGVSELVNKINIGNLDMKTSIDALSLYSKELKSLTISLGNSVENFRVPIDMFKVATDDYCEKNNMFINRFDKSIGNFEQSFELSKDIFIKVDDSINENKNQIKEFSNIINKEFKLLDNSRNEIGGLIHQLKKGDDFKVDSVARSLEKLDKTYLNFEKLIETYKNDVENIKSDNDIKLEDISSKMAKVVSENVIEKISDSLDEISKSTQTLMKVSRNLGEMNSATNEMFDLMN